MDTERTRAPGRGRILRYTADLRSIGFVAIYYSVIVAGFVLPFTWVTASLLTIAACHWAFACGVVTHNSVHTPVFYRRWMNSAFQVLLTMTYGHPVSSYVPGHNLSHHRYMQTDKDLMRTSKARFRWNLLNQLLFGWIVGPVIFKGNIDYVKRMRTRRPRWFRQWCIEFGFYVAYLVLTFGIAIATDWRKFLFYVMIPHQFAAWGIMGTNFFQHDGTDSKSPYNHSRNFTGKIVNWLIVNNGYHGIHHMHPTLHWSLAPAVHAKELAPHIDPALEQTNFVGWLFRAYIWPGKRLNFDGTPVVLPPPEPDGEWIDAQEPPSLVAAPAE